MHASELGLGVERGVDRSEWHSRAHTQHVAHQHTMVQCTHVRRRLRHESAATRGLYYANTVYDGGSRRDGEQQQQQQLSSSLGTREVARPQETMQLALAEGDGEEVEVCYNEHSAHVYVYCSLYNTRVQCECASE